MAELSRIASLNESGRKEQSPPGGTLPWVLAGVPTGALEINLTVISRPEKCLCSFFRCAGFGTFFSRGQS